MLTFMKVLLLGIKGVYSGLLTLVYIVHFRYNLICIHEKAD